MSGDPPPGDIPPGIDDHPDVSRLALQALRGDSLYFNVAGSGPTFPIAQRAAELFRTWLNQVGMFSHVGYDAYNDALARTRADVATAVGDPGGASRIALAQSATDALNALVAGLRMRVGAVVVTTAEEHGSALLPVFARRIRGDRVLVVAHRDDDSFLGEIDAAFREGAQALVVSLVSCKTGKQLPVAEATRLARAVGAVVVVDCAQALGHVPVDVRALGADAVAMLGYKWLHGPLGTGALWVADPERFDVTRRGWRSQTAIDLDGGMTLQPDASRFEAGTVDAAAFMGLRQALVVHRLLGPAVPERVRSLRGRLVARLAELPLDLVSRPEDSTGIVVVAPRSGDAAGIVSRMWGAERIVVKHLSEPGQREAIRISFWALHQDADIDRLAAGFARCLAVPV